MSKHTPGPWEAVREVSGLGRIVSSLGEAMDGGLWIVQARSVCRDDQMPANAHLIAAAPDLLEALKIAVQYIPDGCIPVALGRQITAAIAKAEGEA